MSRIASLYEDFGVLPTCTDSELRKAYRDLLFKTHPDQNQQDLDATLKTQHLNYAYAELKSHRAQAASGDQPSVTVPFSFSFAVDVQKVAGIKARFKASWEVLRDQPTDPVRALQFIHAAFQAERGDSDFVVCLLVDPILIDLASALLSDVTETERYARRTTLSRWARYLQIAGRVDDAIQILEDAVSSGLASPELKDDLRSQHYAAAQYAQPTTGAKSDSRERIAHLQRILELGYDLDYIHKLLAEAYHDLGDDERARACLEQAYRTNPDLSGAVRISRALGFGTKKHGARQEATTSTALRWTQPAQVPAPWQVRQWAEGRNWSAILDFSKPGDYSLRILPAARTTLWTIATSLGNCEHPAAESALTELLHFDHYWDVARAAATALSKIGGATAVAALEEYGTKITGGRQSFLSNCVSYLRARIQNSNALFGGDYSALLAQARQEAARHDYGLARFHLENVMKRMEREHRDFDRTTALWARSCAEMDDFQRAIEIVQPVYAALRDSGDRDTVAEIGGWLWSAARQYHGSLDELYQWALELNLSLIATATTPDDVLGPLRNTTRWLETVGRGASANIIRELIRKEAPGTLYVDAHNRDRYPRQVTLSDMMENFLKAFDTRIKAEAVPKLKKVMESEHSIGTRS